MKTVLILGITGNFGLQMAMALNSEGWKVKALIRDVTKAPTWLNKEDCVIGSAQDKALLKQATEGVDMVVYAINPAYHQWKKEAMALLEPAVQVAEELGLRFLFPGNVYNFSPDATLISETAEMHPITEKGSIRVAMEARLKKASEQGALVTIVRAGDFLSPNMHFSWIDMILKEKNGKFKMNFPHDDEHVHFWTYLPDLCANTAKLMEMPQSSFEIWHDPGLALKRNDWQRAFVAQDRTLQASSLAWWSFRLISPVAPVVREVLKMRYLWQQPVVLDGHKMKQALKGQLQQTQLSEIIETLRPSKPKSA